MKQINIGIDKTNRKKYEKYVYDDVHDFNVGNIRRTGRNRGAECKQ